MKIKKLHCWFSLPELGLGTLWMWWFRHRDSRNDDEKDIKAIQFAIEKWMTHFDTAELYGTWAAETILWKAIKGYEREKLQIASKVKGSNCSYNAIKIACEKSLERLDIDYLDLYYIHWREKQFDLKDCMKAMDELIEEGKIKNIWVSNFSVSSLKEAQSYTKNKIVANQVHYNLIYREDEKELLEHCEKNDVLLVAYRALELWKIANYWWSQVVEIALKYDKQHSQIALNFLTQNKNTVALFKSSDRGHIKENLWAIWWEFDNKDFEKLEQPTKKTVYKSDCIPLN